MIIIISLILSAFFSGMEIAYVSSDKLNLEIQKKQVGFISNILRRITKEPSKFISTMLIGNNFALVVYGFFMGDFIINYLLINIISELNELTIVLIQTSISTIIILIAAEFIPKTVFQIYSDFFIRIFAVPAYIFYIIFSPLTNTVTLISDYILNKFFNTDSKESKLSFTKVELENFIENEIQHSQDEIDTEIEIFQNALELSEIKARDIMVPRTEIIAVDLKMNIKDVKKVFIDTGFSKLPVYKKSIDNIIDVSKNFDIVTKESPDIAIINDLVFASIIAKHTKSNCIILAKDYKLIGSGMGQVSRIDALNQAIEKSKNFGFKSELDSCVMASDAFFPFKDCVELANSNKIKNIIQPGGSIRDNESIEFCDKHKMTMIFTRTRHFRH